MPKRSRVAVIAARKEKRSNYGTKPRRVAVATSTATDEMPVPPKEQQTKQRSPRRKKAASYWKRHAMRVEMSEPIRGVLVGKQGATYVVELVDLDGRAFLDFASCPGVGSKQPIGSHVSLQELWRGKDGSMRVYDPTFL